MGELLSSAFYENDDVVGIAKALVGTCLYSRVDDELTGGIIVETEAYRGPEDRGSHAWNHKRTPRNEIMYSKGGVTYMYICYGIHDMLNVVTGPAGTSHAVLIRAIQPTQGMDMMRDRRQVYDDDTRLCKGPGALAKALGINKLHNGLSLHGDVIWIEEGPTPVPEENILATARIGLNIVEPYKSIPWRFLLKGNRFVSAKKS